ncbi:MAG: type I glyceraldehyde-3-phosphate dehydrogenase [Patescibacteria group bacterium]|nr:type I glyceraldehyde-3-phosphate dehydrogenase [Patescibacteria group bacterium]MDE2172772.1 type I glyceraldehyde-3-phosphate dehydrogenase [Patescibacteria group bacterium]
MSKKIRVAINGFGRIGRAFAKVARERPEIEIVAVNDLGSLESMAYLLKYDSAYGVSPFDVSFDEAKKVIIMDGHEIQLVSEKDPTKLPWKAMDIDVVVESTGLFTSGEKSQAHITAGAKRVVVSAPIKDAPDAAVKGVTVLMAMNEDKMESCPITSNASCTTNAGSPLIAIMDETIGIEKAVLNTVHGYTASQALVDGPSKKDLREGRAAAMNIVPSSTGAAIAVTEVATQLKGKFDGISIRVPVIVGSIVDVTFIAKRATSAEEVNNLLRKAAAEKRWAGVFTVTDEPLVSRDIVGNRHASIADLAMTRVVDGTLVKVMAWYDNEMGYTHTLVEHVIKAGRLV